MANTNCLEGWKCPKCGHTHDFKVNATSWFDLFDDGTGNNGSVIFDEGSPVLCPMCGYEAQVHEFCPSFGNGFPLIETQKTWVLSTSHIPQPEAEILNSGAKNNPILYPHGEYGWDVYVGKDVDYSTAYRHLTRLSFILHTAKYYGIDWVRLDRDGNEYPDLFPVFEW